MKYFLCIGAEQCCSTLAAAGCTPKPISYAQPAKAVVHCLIFKHMHGLLKDCSILSWMAGAAVCLMLHQHALHDVSTLLRC
jgi:hypothetical protein